MEIEIKDSSGARKVQKADREKLRRDRLNEQFVELGKALDPDRPKNDKATILVDAIQMLKELTAQVSRLKEEYGSLSEESRELTQEKNELKEEKLTIKNEIDNLQLQYQQRLRVLYPWGPSVDPSMLMGAPPFPYPMPVHMPTGPLPLHPSFTPYPFFRDQNPASAPTHYPAFSPFPPVNLRVEHPSVQYAPPPPPPHHHHQRPTSNPQVLNKQESKRNSTELKIGSTAEERSYVSDDVATDLELKTPGSAMPSSAGKSADKEKLTDGRKGKGFSSPHTNRSFAESCSSKFSPSCSLQDSSSDSVGDGSVANT